jgi:hypothetical protein
MSIGLSFAIRRQFTNSLFKKIKLKLILC